MTEAVAAGSRTLSVAEAAGLNGRLRHLERAFIVPRGIPGRPNYRHVVFATSIDNNYEGVSFAGIADSANAYIKAGDEAGKRKWLAILRVTHPLPLPIPLLPIALLLQESITDVQYGIESAILTLDLSGFHFQQNAF